MLPTGPAAMAETRACGLFGRLKTAAGPVWTDYVDHPFVRGLGDGSLPAAAFRHYLIQDYLFLIQFARAYALAAYKAETLSEMREAAAMVSALIDTEMALHLEYCADWGLSEADVTATEEDLATTAYTRFVLERGMAGDALDLHVALAPCVVGYAEIGRALSGGARAGTPYARWIDMYAGDEYQEIAAGAARQLDVLAAGRGGAGREASLARVFTQATRLEVAFWGMGLAVAEGEGRKP